MKLVQLLLLSFVLQAQALKPHQPPFQLNEIPQLIQEVIHNQKMLDGKGLTVDYVSSVRASTKWFDRKGQLKSSELHVYDQYPAYPKSILIFTETNGIPTKPSKLEHERSNALKEMERFLALRNKIPSVLEFENSPGYRIYLGVYPFLRNSEFYKIENDSNEGRPSIKLGFRPKTGWVDPKGIMHHLSGDMWIDLTDKIVVKLIAWVTETDLPQNLFFEMSYKMVFPETWCLTHFRINPSVNSGLFKNERFDWSFDSSDFQRFSIQQPQTSRTDK